MNFLCKPKTALVKFIATQQEEETSFLTRQCALCVYVCLCMYARMSVSVCVSALWTVWDCKIRKMEKKKRKRKCTVVYYVF